MDILCLCGCEQKVKPGNRFILGHNGFKRFLSKETRRKLSEARTGKNNGMYGKIPSDEHKRKISESNKNRIFTDEHKQKLSEANAGRIFTKETKRKISESKIGSKNPAWKGGISCEPYCEQWSDKDYKESIKQRDGYECKNPTCWKTSNSLIIHHINYIKKDCRPFNLITLCRSCNVRANTNRQEWQLLYENITSQGEK